MGIKGIYGEIGPGERISLSKLAIEKYERTGRPLRIAVDISIWLFQIQAGQGGSNPAIRTFYYRLLRLLSLSVQPLFVFDGPHKPRFKRNKRTGHQGATLPHLLAKQLLKLVGFPFHIAPGEAEAECALLQREGIVDAVLSEDVDTLMFGCGLTFRNWSSEGGVRGNKSPTHVSVYDAQVTKNGKSGLDREGMVLVALMSGGDYNTEGIPGCGIKVACEAARAGYGKSLCQLSKTDIAGLDAWRKVLAHELQTNEGKYFRVKHKTLKIPEDFPNSEVLSYYTHPVVSSAAKIQKLQEDVMWDGEVDVPGLRLFVAEAFDWTHKIGARKFIRGLAPAVLIHKLRARGDRRDSGYGDVILTAMNEMELVRSVCGKRCHFSTDGIPELRVIYHPAEIVGLDMDAEEDDSEDYGRDGLAPLNDDDEIDAYVSDGPFSTARTASPSKRGPSLYDPTGPAKAWIPETIAKVGIPLKVEDYEESLRNPKKIIKSKHAAKKAASKGGMPPGAIDRFVKMSKPGMASGSRAESTYTSIQPAAPRKDSDEVSLRFGSSQPALLPSKPTKISNPRDTRSKDSSNKEINSSKSIRDGARSNTKDLPQKPAMGATRPISTQPNNIKGTPLITKYLNRQKKPSMASNLKPIQHNIYDLTSSSTVPSPPPSPIAQQASPIRTKHTRSTSSPNESGAQEIDESPELATIIQKHNEIGPLFNSSPSHHDQGRPSPRKKRSPLTHSHPSPSDPRPSLNPQSTPLNPQPTNRIIDFRSKIIAREGSSSPELPTMAELLPSRHGLPRTAERVSPRITLPQEIITLSSSPPTTHQSSSWPAQTQNPTSPPPRLDFSSAQHNDNLRPSRALERKYIALRDSLPGTWKQVDGSEEESRRGKGRRLWRESQVEIVDLSGD